MKRFLCLFLLITFFVIGCQVHDYIQYNNYAHKYKNYVLPKDYEATIEFFKVEKTAKNKLGETIIIKKDSCYLFVGTQEHLNLMSYIEVVLKYTNKTVLVHPVKKVAKDRSRTTLYRWYLDLYIEDLFIAKGAVFDNKLWPKIPELAKAILLCLGVEDDDLLVISYDNITGSCKIFYHPDYDYNLEFYEEKLKLLKDGLKRK